MARDILDGLFTRTTRLILRAGVVAATVATLLTAWPHAAHAHADLISANPAPNSVATAAVEKIVLTFSERVVLFGSGVTVSDGQQTYTTTPSIAGNVVTAALASPLGGGTYDVTVNFTSSDGHQSTSSYPFSIAANVVVPTTVPASSTTGAPTTTGAATTSTAAPTTTTTVAPKPAEPSTQLPNWALYAAIGLGMVGVAFAVRGIVVLVRRRRG